MNETSTSLLEILRDRPDDTHWRRLVDLYSPLIRHWLGRHALLDADTDDLVQEVLCVVVRRMPEFHKFPRTGSFRCWLRTITANCLRDFWRARRIRPRATGDSDFQEMLEQLHDPNTGMSHQWDQEHDRFIMRRLLQNLRPEFQDQTWSAFEKLVIDGSTPNEVAAELGITVNAVFIAKSRVLSRLRQEAKGLVEEL